MREHRGAGAWLQVCEVCGACEIGVRDIKEVNVMHALLLKKAVWC